MSFKSGRNVCVSENCGNKGYNCNMRFFTFPKDKSRAKIWLLACGRGDLIEKLNEIGKLSDSYRLCSAHFEEKMFVNYESKHRLLPSAIPRLFTKIDGRYLKTLECHNYSSRPQYFEFQTAAVSNMRVKEEIICRLCLSVADNDFQIIDESTRTIFKFILLRVNLDISKDPIMCKDCAEAVEQCFNFKSICIDRRDTLFSFGVDQNRSTLELEDGYREEENKKPVNNFMCRFCSNRSSESNFVLLDTLMKDVTFVEMLRTLMPEMDFNVIKNPIICTSCTYNLEYYVKFVKNCLEVEQKITKHIQHEGTPSTAQVKLGEIRGLLFTNISALDYTKMCAIKQEDIGEDHSIVYDIGDIIKAEEVNIKDETHVAVCESPSDIPVYELNTPYRFNTRVISTKNVSETEIFNCTVCAYQSKYNSCLKRHMLIHKDITEVELYKCSLCTFETKYKFNLKSHNMLIHKGGITVVDMYMCAKCTYETKDKRRLRKHMLVHKDITQVKMHKCSICYFQTKHRTSLKNHMLIHKDMTEVEMYKCLTCTYETKHRSCIRKHMLIHKDVDEVEMHKCSMCIYETKDKSTLKAHMLVHKDMTEVDTYKCTLCSFETKRNASLKNHMLIHRDITEEETYKCSICSFETKHKTSVKNHMLIHKDITEEEMYKCSTCTFVTKRKGNLKNHMLVHKSIAEVDMYKCSICSYVTKHKGGLRSHALVHKNSTQVKMYKCSVCAHETNRKDSLTSHMLVHKDNKEVEMYKCLMCAYETKHKYYLKTHMLIHKDLTEVETYKCSVCSFQTKHKWNFKRHVNSQIHCKGGNV